MNTSIHMENYVGNHRVVEVLKRAVVQERLPHAMIFSGPEGIGKCTLALLLAQILNCTSGEKDRACGVCSSCKRIHATLQSRHLPCLSQKGDEFCGSCENCRIRMQKHPDVRIVEPEKTTISIDQIRELINEVAFQPFEAHYRIVILDPADQMKTEAQNSLLKTLEEPTSRTVIILVTTKPYMLLETIRSRARLLRFGEIAPDAVEKHLVEQGILSGEDAHLAAVLCGGSLSKAMAFDMPAFREIRKQALRFVTVLLKGSDFKEASNVAAQASKDKKMFTAWVDAAAVLLEDIYYTASAPERVGQIDLLEQFKPLAETTPRATVVSAVKAIRNLQRELQININRQLALESLYLSVASHQ